MFYLVPFVVSCFPDYSLSLCSCISVCAFEEKGTSPTLYRLVSAEKGLYQSVHPDSGQAFW